MKSEERRCRIENLERARVEALPLPDRAACLVWRKSYCRQQGQSPVTLKVEDEKHQR